MKPLKIIETGDGSHTLFNEALNETYHSTHGALTESKHVFIKEGLSYYSEKKPDQKKISILEIGFGTGLNAMLTLQAAIEKDLEVFYYTLEPYPVETEVIEKLNYKSLFELTYQPYYNQLHELPWEVENKVVENFSIVKTTTGLENLSFSEQFDLVYFDAFAPRKQPELWEVESLQNAITSLKTKGVLVTYCAMGVFKRNLKSLEMTVESIPGPPGKREMTRGIK
ncbi:tRNA (5-methylaminomethyl-2-thiouridine)(34)-methyltransferase MnmD [Chondrinema litorale]|uniref:tRNA (5-methylaminomethyl-2-thiouridine)(34)-methyltransferase MnmD n=1 Tax=Chondrinema litorale TaxID=2994555 RepID=UPI0025435208|nr:tRNA (5-methylaminomethyl-2-thiouridine)(34)-methyltransferase MnmD [Chondrinema litorale]UZR95996.1 tRNA (5-methylaminomethyl-2-thiouridine)(34)-methyltransferase MnmD [Chondrinema litorale]